MPSCVASAVRLYAWPGFSPRVKKYPFCVGHDAEHAGVHPPARWRVDRIDADEDVLRGPARSESTTLPPTASCAAVLGSRAPVLRLGHGGVGRREAARSGRATSAGHRPWCRAWCATRSCRTVPGRATSCPCPCSRRAPAQPRSVYPAPPRRMTEPSPPGESRPPAQPEQPSVRQNESPAYHSAGRAAGQGRRSALRSALCSG